MLGIKCCMRRVEWIHLSRWAVVLLVVCDNYCDCDKVFSTFFGIFFSPRGWYTMVVLELEAVYAQAAPHAKLLNKRFLGAHHWLGPLKEALIARLAADKVEMWFIGGFMGKKMNIFSGIVFQTDKISISFWKNELQIEWNRKFWKIGGKYLLMVN